MNSTFLKPVIKVRNRAPKAIQATTLLAGTIGADYAYI
jgi:hypothetical protein